MKRIMVPGSSKLARGGVQDLIKRVYYVFKADIVGPFTRSLRAAARTCSRSHACAASFVRRGCQLIKYGKKLSSRGASAICKSAIGAVILDRVRGTMSHRSVFAIAKAAGIKKGIRRAMRRLTPSCARGRSTIAWCAFAGSESWRAGGNFVIDEQHQRRR